MSYSFRSGHKLTALGLTLMAVVAANCARAQDVKQWAGACVACHPRSSVATSSVNPIIWGQNAGYVYLQLRDFKAATRASESDAAMHALTRTMTDAQMLSIAQYVAAQPWPALQDKTAAGSDSLYSRGALLVAYGDCGACHFNNLQGYSVNPRIRGQTSSYLTTTINEFRSGKRGNSPGMADLLRAYSEDDVKALVAYLSRAD